MCRWAYIEFHCKHKEHHLMRQCDRYAKGYRPEGGYGKCGQDKTEPGKLERHTETCYKCGSELVASRRPNSTTRC